MSIEFRDGHGRRIRPDQIGQHIKKTLEGHVRDFLNEQAAKMAGELHLSSVRCPEHGTLAENWRLIPEEPGRPPEVEAGAETSPPAQARFFVGIPPPRTSAPRSSPEASRVS